VYRYIYIYIYIYMYIYIYIYIYMYIYRYTYRVNPNLRDDAIARLRARLDEILGLRTVQVNPI